MRLTDPAAILHGLGPKTREIFVQHGIVTLEDLLLFFPRAWIDASSVTPVSQVRVGQAAVIDVQVVRIQKGMSQKNRLPYLKALVADASGSLEVIWFHPRFITDKVKPGSRLLLFGHLHGWKVNERLFMSPKFLTEPAIIPVYSQIGGLTSAKIGQLIAQVRPLLKDLPDYLPDHIRQSQGLVSITEAVQFMHFPTSIEEINVAKKRLAFDELVMIMVPSLLAQHEKAEEVTEALTSNTDLVERWSRKLPFSLTDDQQRVIEEICHDLAQTKPMNRLVQGDVGSGKTAVGLAAAIQAIAAGKQVAWLAPTEILARQHYETAKKMLANEITQDIGVGLWTRSHHFVSVAEEKKATLDDVLQQRLVIGTHALLGDKIHFADLGLLIIDEQHRFGVKQRAQLRLFAGRPVHLLSMTATPIPQTMALLLYGDLKLSLIKQKPSGRKPIVTRVVNQGNRAKAYEFIEAHMQNGGQVYVVCPTIEPTQDDEATLFNQLFETIEENKAVTTWHKQLQILFPKRKIGLLHGKMKPAEKETIMREFREHNLEILVSTTVIEVGVDVPNANIIMIENADRFGLAQLHQLRGRVGRGERQSFCFLFPTKDTGKMSERLTIMEETNDGFVLAEKDLQLRGPGELTGEAQTGFPQLRFASFQDTERIESIRLIAQHLITLPELQRSFERFWRQYHPE